MERRWANLYRASLPEERLAVVRALAELTGWPEEQAERTMRETTSSALLQLAEDRIRAVDRPSASRALVHGDVHAGNMLWDGDTCIALIDWKSAGVGDPGVDLGNLRLHLAVQYGLDAARQVLQGWQSESGHSANNLAYWDVVAALNTPAVLWPEAPAFDNRGNRLDPPGATRRRDQFLHEALDQLEPPHRIPRHSRTPPSGGASA